MKYYISDNDSAWAVDVNGNIYAVLADGKLKDTDKKSIDVMKWHECSVNEAVESSKLFDSYFQKLKK